jgi:hypothetical protein
LYSGVIYFDDLRAVKKVIDITAVETDISKHPVKFELAQNYPNPFNPSTVIQYSIPALEMQNAASLNIKLAVYDILGREVAILVNEQKVPGHYSLTWDASGFASGTYIYHLTAGSFSKVRKMILLR